MNWELILKWINIIIIDLTLAGDNALVIAMAVRTLPSRQQRFGLFWGATGAVVIRIILTFAAAQVLQFPFVDLAGGILLIWIAFKLLRQDNGGKTEVRNASTLLEAIWIIMLADLIMSTDNILAVAGASEGNVLLLLFGLGLSIPIVVMGAAFIAMLMGRFGWLSLLGAGVLGEVSGKMSLEDPFIRKTLGEPTMAVEWGIRIGLAALIVIAGIYFSRESVASNDPETDDNVVG
ncbi:MAG: TerC family protein [Candidatus Binatia bacterium]